MALECCDVIQIQCTKQGKGLKVKVEIKDYDCDSVHVRWLRSIYRDKQRGSYDTFLLLAYL